VVTKFECEDTWSEFGASQSKSLDTGSKLLLTKFKPEVTGFTIQSSEFKLCGPQLKLIDTGSKLLGATESKSVDTGSKLLVTKFKPEYTGCRVQSAGLKLFGPEFESVDDSGSEFLATKIMSEDAGKTESKSLNTGSKLLVTKYKLAGSKSGSTAFMSPDSGSTLKSEDKRVTFPVTDYNSGAVEYKSLLTGSKFLVAKYKPESCTVSTVQDTASEFKSPDTGSKTQCTGDTASESKSPDTGSKTQCTGDTASESKLPDTGSKTQCTGFRSLLTGSKFLVTTFKPECTGSKPKDNDTRLKKLQNTGTEQDTGSKSQVVGSKLKAQATRSKAQAAGQERQGPGSKSPVSGAAKQFRCGYCKTVFQDKCELASHIVQHREATHPFKCQVCDKLFRMKVHLMTHMHIHTGERPFKCDVCDRRFYKMCNLKSHHRTQHERYEQTKDSK
jgi:hypothetical protein